MPDVSAIGRIMTGKCERDVADRARGMGLEVSCISDFTMSTHNRTR